MSDEVSYRNYVIHYDGTQFVAEPSVHDDSIFEIGGPTVESITDMIDELWDSLDKMQRAKHQVPLPIWFQRWIEGGGTGRIQAEVPRQPPMTAASWLKRFSLCSAAMIATVGIACAGARLDMNGDSQLTLYDLQIMAMRAGYQPLPPINFTRLVEWQGKRFNLTGVRSREEPDLVRITAFRQIAQMVPDDYTAGK